MSEIPDKVIEEAAESGADELTRFGLRAKPVDGEILIDAKAIADPVVAAAAPVIAAWARAEERERIASRVRAELIPESEHDGSPAGPLGDSITDQTGTIDLGDCLTVDIAEGIARWIEALDRDGSDTREDGK